MNPYRKDEPSLNSPLEFNIYGRQPVLEALRSGDIVKKIWIASDLSGKPIRQIRNMAEHKNIKQISVSKNEIQKYVGPVVHQGIAAAVSFDPFIKSSELVAYLQSVENPLIVILDQVQDPHNFGAILRTSEITGVDLVVIAEKGSAPINATAAKTSAGALFAIKLFQTENLLNLIEQLKEAEVRVLATTPNANYNIYQTDLTVATALIIGSEGAGVRKNILPFCDSEVTIPQKGKINSLNASVSASVILYEALRQRYYDSMSKQFREN